MRTLDELTAVDNHRPYIHREDQPTNLSDYVLKISSWNKLELTGQKMIETKFELLKEYTCVFL